MSITKVSKGDKVKQKKQLTEFHIPQKSGQNTICDDTERITLFFFTQPESNLPKLS